jgi:hypothetical protein
VFSNYASERAKGGSHDSHGVVVEDCGNVFRGKLVRGVADEETCLADRTVADDDAPVEGIVLVLGALRMPEGRLWELCVLDCRDHHVEGRVDLEGAVGGLVSGIAMFAGGLETVARFQGRWCRD